MRTKFHSPGTQVHIGDELSPVTAVIVSTLLQYDYVSYRVAWFDDKTRHVEWLEQFEVREIEASSAVARPPENGLSQ